MVPFAVSAKRIIENDFVNIFELQLTEYQPGSLLESVSIAPFFLLFGYHDIMIFFANFIFNIFILILLFLFLRKFLNEKIAPIVILLFILSPSTFILGSWNINGHLYHSILFSLMTLYLFFDIMFFDHKNFRKYILLGFVSGISLWFDYSLLIMLLAILFFLFAFNRHFLKKGLKWYAPSFVIGFFLWVLSNMQYNFKGLNILYVGTYSGSLFLTIKLFFSNLKNLLFYKIPLSFNVVSQNKFNLVALNYIYYSIILLAIFFLIFRLSVLIKKNISSGKISIKKTMLKEGFLLFYCLFYVIILSLFSYYMFAFSRYHDTFRYLLPIYPFFFIFLGILVYHLSFKNHKHILLKIAGLSLFSFLLVFGCLSFFSSVSFKNTNIKGDFFIMSENMLQRDVGVSNTENLTAGIEECSGFNNISYQLLCYSLLSRKTEYKYDIFYLENYCNEIDTSYRKGCYMLYGMYVSNTQTGLKTAENLLINLSDQERKWFNWGVNWYFEPNYFEYKDIYFDYCPPEYYSPFYSGLAEAITYYHYSNFDYALDECRNLEYHAEYCEERLAWHVAYFYFRNERQAVNNCNLFNGTYRDYCYFALGFSISDHYPPSLEDSFKQCENLASESLDSNPVIFCKYGAAWNLGWKSGNNLKQAKEKCSILDKPYRDICEKAARKYTHLIPLSELNNLLNNN